MQIFKSRQFWTLVVLFIVNGFEGIRENIPADALPLINAVMGFLTIYFRISPKQDFNK